ncbi:MAG: DUF2316 family protein [Lentilactobacillus diolivorans]|jgi:hypothetical protein|uniref:DUF2316 domain-containing protein n=2 Tax=Lentilactobacillus diolivorans TaxID=179838 RepID=A0A0R1S2C2_9LACO|nr:DUF2316 family protein [Lentilactobacillus diolivorans]RRG00545.1 MAG: DUF2316 family protein [Lactobacillus sp.]KRL63239.1 hypothetical protein FC85_GL001669 [Lentilactobacillus diolivorans DSM 14421]MCH4164384.1 DUF2316 family protein [Lentilactobacillus diolivorans]MDH5106114.1 DUF2316 family protein [Lentilactobacillus diolivorans]GEP25100.1 hypothetical protein LDI01_26930 [Lentilactobacillus diolivorans]
MSLTADEAAATRDELQKNFDLAGVSLERAAKDLHSTPEHIQAVLNLHPARIEEPWILRNYLFKQILAQEKEPYPFSKLIGDPKRFGFLNDQFIDQGQLA